MFWNAGDLNIRAFLQRSNDQTSDTAAVTSQWYTVDEMWIGLRVDSGNESQTADRTIASTVLTVKVRKQSGLKASDRLMIKETGRILYFTEPPRDVDGRGGDLEVAVTEGDQDE